MDTITLIGLISSLATLFLFLIYFIGRIITIRASRYLCQEKIVALNHDSDTSDFEIIEQINLLDDDILEPYTSKVLLTSVTGIYDLKIYRVDLINDPPSKKQLVYSLDFINIGKSIEVDLALPDVVPHYLVEFSTNDFRKVKMYLMDNNKSGAFSEFFSSHHTLKSILYYLFR